MLSAVMAILITACTSKGDVQQVGRLTLRSSTLDALGHYHTSRSLYYNKRLVAEEILQYIPSPGDPDVILYEIDGWKDRPGGLFMFNGRTSDKLRVTDEFPMLSLTKAEHWSPDSAYVVIQAGSQRLLVVDVAGGRLAGPGPLSTKAASTTFVTWDSARSFRMRIRYYPESRTDRSVREELLQATVDPFVVRAEDGTVTWPR
jgi:hypothetical protein